MNRNEFNRFVAGGALPGPGDLEGLRELTVLFPWFHSAHLVLLRGLKENADVRFDSQLKASALSVSDREVLYHYLFMSPEAEVAREEVAKEEIRHEEGVLETPALEEERHEEVINEVAVVEEAVVEEVAHEEAVIEEVLQEEVAHEEAVIEEVLQEEVAHEEAVVEEVLQEEVAPEEIPQETSAVGEIIQTEAIKEEVITPIDEAIASPVQEELPPVTPKEAVAAVVAEESTLRTREELMAEIEARLEELASVKEDILELIAEPASDTVEIIVEKEITEPEAIVEEEEPQAIVEEEEPQAIVEEEEPEAIVEEEEPEAIVEEEEPEPEPVAEDLMEFIEDSEPASDVTATHLSAQDLIDRFIKSSPTLERMTLPETQPVRDLAETSAEEKGSFITETLAKIYITQGYYSRAINIYEKLSLQYPEKSAYFAGRIERINDLIK
jgi:hypothetical protein